jgi:hypothetical protein
VPNVKIRGVLQMLKLVASNFIAADSTIPKHAFVNNNNIDPPAFVFFLSETYSKSEN